MRDPAHLACRLFSTQASASYSSGFLIEAASSALLNGRPRHAGKSHGDPGRAACARAAAATGRHVMPWCHACAQGYNDGLKAAGTEDTTVQAQLSAAAAKRAEFAAEDTAALEEAAFRQKLGLAGQELLDHGVRGLVADLGRLEDVFQDLALGSGE